jgi:hypothetical protein
MNRRSKLDFLNVVVKDGKLADRANQLLNHSFPKQYEARWLGARRRLAQAGYGDTVVKSYTRYSSELANKIDPRDVLQLADVVSTVAIKSGKAAAAELPLVAFKAAEKLQGDEWRFRAWLNLIERFANLAPESMLLVLQQMDKLLDRLNVSRLESWLLAGVRAAGSDAERRYQFFSFANPEAERWLERESGSIIFADLQRELKAYLNALWGYRLPLRETSMHAPDHVWRRATFGGGIIHMPPAFTGFPGDQASDLFRACVAHIGAHLRYSLKPFPVKQLKPMQVALISLIEDARVEYLAMQEFPGLRRLWLPFHIALPSGVMTAPNLFARLSRALIDPHYQDGDGWVRRGREMVDDAQRHRWDQDASREIGGLLGNNLGQMRVQFNAKTFVVEPAYRDDNRGLWDFGEQQSAMQMESEMLFDAAQMTNETDQLPDEERNEGEQSDDEQATPISIQVVEDEGIAVARYSEYDYITGRERQEWTTIVEFSPSLGPVQRFENMLEQNSDLVNRIKQLISNARVSRPQKLYKQHDGDYLDIDACIDAEVSKRLGEQPDPRVYTRTERRQRDLSVLVLLDISESTNDKIVESKARVIEVECQATAMLAQAMAGLNDPFAIAAFCSNQREEVRYYRVKNFNTPYDERAQSCLAGLSGGLSTRLGAAIRHAAEDLKTQLTHRRLILVLSDGEPSDIDISDKNYLVEDARHAVHSLARHGIDVFCVGLDSGGENYLTRIFGLRNFVLINKIESLPERLPMLYFRLTA